MLKRNKDILDLPDKLFYTEYLEMETKQRKMYNEVKNNIDSRLKIELNSNRLSKVTRLRQITSAPELISNEYNSVKIDRMLEIVEENLVNNQKVIIYSNWSEVVKVAKSKLSENNINSVTITRETMDKMAEIDKFRNSSDHNVIIGTIASLGTGYSLPEANTIIFLDSPYTDSELLFTH